MADKLYRLYCDYCAYSRWTDGTDIGDLVPYKRSPIQTGIPKYDPVAKKIVTKPFQNLPKQFKCPQCGRLLTPRKYMQPPPTSVEEQKNEENPNSGSQTGSP